MDTSGNLYGTTHSGGAYNNGTVFELTPDATKTAWTETVVHSFCPRGTNCPDGAAPQASLIIDASGNLYGTTYDGGAHGAGVVFELTPNAAKTAWSETVLWNLGAPGDGGYPYAGLFMDASGHLYGTTSGGANGVGVVFELTSNTAKTAWTEKVLYSFCSLERCTDGEDPFYGGVIMDASGNLYGTTDGGGVYGLGVVFKLTPNTAKTAWTETVLHDFCSTGGASCTDGSEPIAGLVMDTLGNLYGTTYRGGTHNGGVVFELTPNTAKTAWTEKVLYSFCSLGNCTDGGAPWAGVIMDTSGKLYGTTVLGGAHGQGTLFELTPNAAKTIWTETVYSFCSEAQGTICFDGQEPYAGLIMDKSGNLYGTTSTGGLHGRGTVFEQ